MLGIIECFYLGSNQDWKIPAKVDLVKNKTECRAQNIYFLAMGFIPYWLRLLQCLNNNYYTKQRRHLLNALKYFSDMLIPLAGLPIWYTSYQHDAAWYWYIVAHVVASAYSYAWDIYMDFGLCRHFENDEKKYLRPKIMYQPSFYWYMMISDLILRFVWFFGLYRYGPSTSTYNRM